MRCTHTAYNATFLTSLKELGAPTLEQKGHRMTSDEMTRHLEMLLADSKVRHRDIELLLEVATKQSEEIAGLVAATKDLRIIASSPTAPR
jgi:hypothetical protein